MAEAFGDRAGRGGARADQALRGGAPGPLADLAAHYAAAPARGEITVLVGPPAQERRRRIWTARLRAALATHSVKDAAALVAGADRPATPAGLCTGAGARSPYLPLPPAGRSLPPTRSGVVARSAAGEGRATQPRPWENAETADRSHDRDRKSCHYVRSLPGKHSACKMPRFQRRLTLPPTGSEWERTMAKEQRFHPFPRPEPGPAKLGPGPLQSPSLQVLSSYTDWRKTWTHIVAGKFTASPLSGLLFYEQSTGTAEFYATDGEGGISLLRHYDNWRRSWTLIVPGIFGNSGNTGLLL